MTEREKIAHVLRRFGFGATYVESLPYQKLGFEGTITKLFDFAEEPQDPHPFRFAWRKGEEADLNTYRFRNWWTYKIISSQNPLKERMAIFWHNHFAVADSKVENGLQMLSYMVALRKDPLGKFHDVLKAMVTEPAFMRMLDVKTMIKGTPNENFARELLELYTFGIGHYTEKDIQEISRAMTGWTFIDPFWESQLKVDERVKSMMKNDFMYSAFAWVPTHHDDSPKTILGKTGKFDGFDVLKMLSADKRCATFISTKLWEHFAAPNPPQAIVDRLVGVYTKTGGQISEVLKAIAKSPEFYSPEIVGKRVKSPFDFVIGLNRGMGLGPELKKLVDPGKPDEPIKEELMNEMGGINYWMDQTGMQLMEPPGVQGWPWGEGWITQQNMLRRMQYRGNRTYYQAAKDKWLPTAMTLSMVEFMKPHKDLPVEQFREKFCEFWDVKLSADANKVVEKKFQDHNFKGAFEDQNNAAWMLTVGLQMLVAAPEFHLH